MSHYQGSHSIAHSDYNRHKVKSSPVGLFLFLALVIIALVYFFGGNVISALADSNDSHFRYNPAFCVAYPSHYARGMVTGSYAFGLTHATCEAGTQEKQKENQPSTVTTVTIVPPSTVTTPPAIVPPAVEPPVDNPPANNPPAKSVHPNSGGGNGSEIDPATGEDVDPGKSGGHNNGKD